MIIKYINFVAACIVTVGLTSMSVARAQAAGGPTIAEALQPLHAP
jgi:hypothetical protein